MEIGIGHKRFSASSDITVPPEIGHRVSVTAPEAIHDLMEKMTHGRFRHLPVEHDGKLAGIISIGDVVKMRVAETQMEADSMRDYITKG